MNLNLKGKVFIISGSSGGIGKGIARIILKEGGRVFLTGVDENKLKRAYHELVKTKSDSVLYLSGDLNDEKVLKRIERLTISRWGKIDGIIANAGAVRQIDDFDPDKMDWEWYLNSNFMIAVNFIRPFIKYLKSSSGSIVLISSIAGIEDIGAPLPYSVSKAALNMYAKGLSRRLARYSIRVNTVLPGNIIFPGGNWEKKKNSNFEKTMKMIEEKVPLKTFGVPDDIGNIVTFLLSDKAQFITGGFFVVDGGQSNLI